MSQLTDRMQKVRANKPKLKICPRCGVETAKLIKHIKEEHSKNKLRRNVTRRSRSEHVGE